MKMIFNYLYLIKKITFTQRFNAIIYYLKMIPVIKKLIPDSWYHRASLKKVASVIWLILSFLGLFLSKTMYVGIMIYLPIQFLSKSGVELFNFIWIFLFLSGIAGPILAISTVQPQKQEYIMISLMHMNERRYVFAKWLWDYGIGGGVLLLVLIGYFIINQQPFWYAAVLYACYLSAHILGEAINIRYFQTHPKPLNSNYVFYILVFLSCYGIAYGGTYFFTSVPFSEKFLISVMCCFPLGLMYAIPVLMHTDYTTLMHKGILLNRNIYDGTLVKANNQAQVELKDKDYDAAELKQKKYEKYHGYEYLNALFFQRHKRLFFRPMRRRILGILALFVAIDLFIIFVKPDLSELRNPYKMLPPTVFMLYFISIGERVTRAMFYNCDNSLLHFGYYRQPKAILTNFRIRLRKIIQMNCLLATLLSIGYGSVILLVWQPDFQLIDHLILIVSFYSISIFFSVHHLFLYYILQPYTGELEMRSPMFGIINTVVYFACYLLSQLDGTKLLAMLILLVTILYSIVALIIVKKVAPTNFHIR